MNQTLKGFRDFLPEDMAIRSRVISILKSTFEKYGYGELQTPTLEYADVLKGKYGEEAEKLMYFFTDNGGREVGLNYDLTVPLARVASQYPTLPNPFKRYQIQSSYRAENTQKGRYRQFTQCDIDCVGSNSPLVDAELLAITSEVLTTIGISNFKIRVNTRRILYQLLAEVNIPENMSQTVLQSIDKLDKKTPQDVAAELETKGISSETFNLIYQKITTNPPTDPNLDEIISLAQKLGAKNIVFDPTVVRGLDYYTGMIVETVVTEPKIGSLTGGGRYDNLIKQLGGPDLPAVGTTFGLDRICDVIEELNLWPNVTKTQTKVLVAVFDPTTIDYSIGVAKTLRQNNINTEIYPEGNTKLDKQIKYALAKSIPYLIIVGPDELSKNIVTLKDLTQQTQVTLSLAEAVRTLEK